MPGIAKFARGFVCAAAMIVASATQTPAQTWPSKPVTLIVPFVAGGTTDIVARLVGQALSGRLGQSVIIENIGGAGGTLGATTAARAPADGYTIFMSTIAHTIAPGIYKKLNYDFEKDFEPITVVASVPNILLVNPDVPAKDVGELIAYIRANPGKVNFGSAGVGSVEHLAGELFRSLAKLDIVHVPYRGGAPMMADIVAGHIQMAIETSGAATPFIKGDKVRALAVSTAKRTPLFPELPTLAESGLPGYDVTTWYGMLVPKGTPPEIARGIYAALVGILKEPDMIARLHEIGAEPGGEPPAQFAAFIRSETEKWTKVTAEAGVKAE
jgi:tripartite-type tricarboxylate transporter receptor subunit TctC